MRAAKFLSISSLILLSSCAKETVGYFTCVYGTLPDRFSLVIDTERKTILFHEKGERMYEESGTNFLVSRVQLEDGITETLEFDRVTGKFRTLREWTNSSGNPDSMSLRYQCEKTEKLI